MSFTFVREIAGTTQTERQGVPYSAPSFDVECNPYDLSSLINKRFDHLLTRDFKRDIQWNSNVPAAFQRPHSRSLNTLANVREVVRIPVESHPDRRDPHREGITYADAEAGLPEWADIAKVVATRFAVERDTLQWLELHWVDSGLSRY